MAIRTVAVGQSIQAAIDAANPGDTIDVAAGNYGAQFLTIRKSLTLEAIGGPAIIHTTANAPDGKAIITEGADGIAVNISGFDVSGAVVGDNNGAAVRYEGGTLNLSNVHFHDNQQGLLGGAYANGVINIDHSEIDHNGTGTGSTHGLYVGLIAKFTLSNSYVHDTPEGHEVKSRAATNVITGNRIFDNTSTASYTIDLPNGGNATIQNNTIEQGPNTHNPAMIAYGEEGIPANYGRSVAFTGNTIVNDDAASNASFVLNPTGTPLTFSNNQVYGFGVSRLPAGSGTILLTNRPSIDTSAMQFIYPGTGTAPPPPQPPPPPPVQEPPPPTVTMTLSQYHSLILADFNVYSKAHPEVWQNSLSVHALMTEISSTTILVHVPGDVWSGL